MNPLRPLIAFFKRVRRTSYQDPARDWLVLITFVLIALAGLIVWDVWAFDTVARGGVIGAPAKVSESLFDSSALDTIRTTFESRAIEEIKYTTGVYTFVDPSQ